jgi:hypothetical protein
VSTAFERSFQGAPVEVAEITVVTIKFNALKFDFAAWFNDERNRWKSTAFGYAAAGRMF